MSELLKISLPDGSVREMPEGSTPADVAAAITPRTRMIMINTPHNPAAAILSPQDLAELARIVSHADCHTVGDCYVIRALSDHGLCEHEH